MSHSWHKLHFYKKSNFAIFFHNCNAKMAQWRWKSWNLDIQSQFSMSKMFESFYFFHRRISIFFFLNIFFDNFNFKITLLLKWRLIGCTISALKIWKNILKYLVFFDYIIKMKCNFLNCLFSFSCLEKTFQIVSKAIRQ